MKVATIGLVFGAMNIATTKASLFDEANDMDLFQEDYDDFEDDRMLQSVDEDDQGDDQPLLARQNGRWGRFGGDDDERPRGGRRGGRKGRRQGKRRGRKGRRGGKKGKGQPFDIEKHEQKILERFAKKESKMEKKCEKKLEWANKICGVSNKPDCDQWALAQKVKCESNYPVRIANKKATALCMGQYKHMMASFKHDTLEPLDDMTMASVGDCFSDALADAQEDFEGAAAKYEAAMQGVTEFDEKELAEAKQALKAAKKAERKAKKMEKRQQKKAQWKKNMQRKRGQVKRQWRRNQNQYRPRKQQQKRNWNQYSESETELE